MSGANDNMGAPLRIAIVGAGPSGLYAAERLIKVAPASRIDIFDRLPVPFGLIRYGVASDHQSTKGVARVLARVFDKPGVRFLGHVEIGRDVTLEMLRDHYDGVLLAIGVGEDRRLGIPGEDLGHVFGSWAFTGWTNGRPGHPPPEVDWAQVRHVGIIGLGNVAIDVARLFLKGTGGLEGSDLGQEASEALARAPIEAVTILGRASLDGARFGLAELSELLALPGLATTVSPPAPKSSDSPLATPLRAAQQAGTRRLHLRFGATPVELQGPERVTGIRLAEAEATTLLPVDLVISCIGYACSPFCGLAQEEGRFLHDGHRIADDLYVAGWAATGPRGTIASSRQAAHAVADRMLAEVTARGLSGLDPAGAIGFDGWKRIDAAETAAATPTRVRTKLETIEAMLAVAR